MNWKQFWKNQILMMVVCTIPFVGTTILELITEDRILNSYEQLIKSDWCPPKWVFSIVRDSVLSLIAYASYRILTIEELKKHPKKVIAGLLLYAVLLICDWLTIFLSPTKLDIAAYFYLAIIPIAFNTAMIFQKIDKFAHFFFIPYILWITLMGILHYHLFINNDNGYWYSNMEIHNSTTNATIF